MLENLERLGVESLIAIGGDGTLKSAAKLQQLGVKVMGIPKTMDNDVHGTEYCVGFSTAITRATDAIDRQRTTIGSHERVGIFRVFGRDAGFTALFAAHVTSNRCVIPKYPVDLKAHRPAPHREAGQPFQLRAGDPLRGRHLEGLRGPGVRPRRRAGTAQEGQRRRGALRGDRLRTGEETIVSDLTYDLRSGEPDFMDKLVASTFGTMALDALLDGAHGQMSAIVNGCYYAVLYPLFVDRAAHRGCGHHVQRGPRPTDRSTETSATGRSS